MSSFSDYPAGDLHKCASHFKIPGHSKMRKGELASALSNALKIMKNGDVVPKKSGKGLIKSVIHVADKGAHDVKTGTTTGAKDVKTGTTVAYKNTKPVVTNPGKKIPEHYNTVENRVSGTREFKDRDQIAGIASGTAAGAAVGTILSPFGPEIAIPATIATKYYVGRTTQGALDRRKAEAQRRRDAQKQPPSSRAPPSTGPRGKVGAGFGKTIKHAADKGSKTVKKKTVDKLEKETYKLIKGTTDQAENAMSAQMQVLGIPEKYADQISAKVMEYVAKGMGTPEELSEMAASLAESVMESPDAAMDAMVAWFDENWFQY